ncbi:MAG: adenine phosphoribosyltransferase [Bdellovibrionales bacterium]|nr:adenine phosphoribosyltransferase [Bdellovibrionales bacterium]
MNLEEIEKLIEDIPDFPQEGILFKNITPILGHPEAFQSLAKIIARSLPEGTEKIVAMESRGFILGAAVVQHFPAGLVLVRKPGKLPGDVLSYSYDLEYGTDTLQVRRADLKRDEKVVILDDVLATGGTAQATEHLCRELGTEVLGFRFLLEIDFLKGKKKLKAPVQSLMHC